MKRDERQRIDRITYDLYVDTNCDAKATAKNAGVSVATVKARVRRHVLRERA